MFALLKNLLKFVFYLILFIFLLVTLVPYFFSLKNKELSTTEKPYDNSAYLIRDEFFMHYRTFHPEKVKHKIILLPGFSGSTFSYHHMFDSLVSNQCMVVAVDIPPFGFSVKNNDLHYTDTLILTMIRQIMNQTDSSLKSEQPWIIAGHSLGVNYVAKMVSRYPDLFTKQVYIDGYYFGNPKSNWNKFALYPPLMKGADVLLEKYYLSEEKFAELLESAYGRKATAEEISAYKKPFEYAQSGSSVFKWASADPCVEVNPDIVYKKPTLVIWGRNDTWVPFNEEDFNIKAFDAITFKMIDSAGHIPQETHPKEVSEILINFIRN